MKMMSSSSIPTKVPDFDVTDKNLKEITDFVFAHYRSRQPPKKSFLDASIERITKFNEVKKVTDLMKLYKRNGQDASSEQIHRFVEKCVEVNGEDLAAKLVRMKRHSPVRKNISDETLTLLTKTLNENEKISTSLDLVAIAFRLNLPHENAREEVFDAVVSTSDEVGVTRILNWNKYPNWTESKILQILDGEWDNDQKERLVPLIEAVGVSSDSVTERLSNWIEVEVEEEETTEEGEDASEEES